MTVIRVVIVSGIRLYREGLADLLARAEGIAVLGSTADGQSGVACILELLPDVALLDMSILEHAAMIRAIADAAPAVKVVALGVWETERHVLACAEAGAAGYVPRDASIRDLAAVVQSVSRDELPCSPKISASLFHRVASLAHARQEPAPSDRLTSREIQILSLIDAGLSNKEIARRLSIELSTVKNHVHNILQKLRARGRSQAVAAVKGDRWAPRI
jgi:two-component system nitrate/nitrite response regulator NarL